MLFDIVVMRSSSPKLLILCDRASRTMVQTAEDTIYHRGISWPMTRFSFLRVGGYDDLTAAC